MGYTATVADVVAMAPDVAIIATGSTPSDLKGASYGDTTSVPTVSVAGVLTGVAQGRKVVVIDRDGHYKGPGVSE